MLRLPVESSQYRAIRYTQRLAEASAVASAGGRGDSYDNALAEAFNSLFNAEMVRNRGPSKSIADFEIAVVGCVDGFNYRSPHGDTGLVPPVQYEEAQYASQQSLTLSRERALTSV